MKGSTASNVDEYILQSPEAIRDRLQRMREIIRREAPDAVESISYMMPAYKMKGKPLVYFGGYPRHIGFYATPAGHEAFASELAGYKQGKGSVQFPHSRPLPEDLISRMIRFRVQQG
jgi:uncharacterized protein YdhG (YjbR/CyaY superfamily)